MTNISIQLCDYDNKFIINNIYPLYLYDLGEIRNVYPNKYGVFEEDDSIKTLEEQIHIFDIWWNKKGILFPYLITVDGLPAGFVFVATPPYLVDDSDFMISEMFIMRQFRGKGVGEYAVTTILNKYLGNWMLFTTPTDSNLKTIKFWRKTLSHYTNNQFTEENKDILNFGFSKVFKFTNNNINHKD